MSLSALPSLRETLDAQGLGANKSFGQHFLLDLNVTRKIVRLAGPFPGEAVIEVGPGPGGLTRALLESEAACVIAVEKDGRFLPLLNDLRAASQERLTIVEGDALNVSESALLAENGYSSAHIVSNLPYNVGTPLLIKWLTGPFRPIDMTLMFQREVADRICASVGDDAYGRLSVLTQTLASAKKVMDLPARAFTPPPKVDSAVVKITPKPGAPDAAAVSALEHITAHAFGQRRKMLRSSLKAIGGETLCTAAGIDAQLRAEAVDIDGFMKLARAFLATRPPHAP